MSTALPTRTVTINAAFLQEIKEVNQELWQLLANCREFVDQPSSMSRPCSMFVEMLQELRDKLALHFALEDAYGYFDDPLEVPPRFAQRAMDLREEHATLYLSIAELAEEAGQLLHQRHLTALTTTIPPKFETFHERLQKHEAAETDLIQNTFVEDIGEGD